MNYYGNNDYRDYLAHHGILGQKWGIRRFQAYGSGGYDRKGGKTGKVIGETKTARGPGLTPLEKPSILQKRKESTPCL